jgi:hypothetical protein
MQYNETRKLPPIKPNQQKHKTIHFHTINTTRCKKNLRQILIPVFYGVDPTIVRHQKKSYENAFSELLKKV